MQDGKRITITVDNSWGEHPINGDWHHTIDLATSGAFHLTYERPADDADAAALVELFEGLGFVRNRDHDPVWTVYQTPPAGTIARLREGLVRLGYSRRLWCKRTYRIAAELGDDPQDCSYVGAPADHQPLAIVERRAAFDLSQLHGQAPTEAELAASPLATYWEISDCPAEAGEWRIYGYFLNHPLFPDNEYVGSPPILQIDPATPPKWARGEQRLYRLGNPRKRED